MYKCAVLHELCGRSSELKLANPGLIIVKIHIMKIARYGTSAYANFPRILSLVLLGTKYTPQLPFFRYTQSGLSLM
jgi:hypothetical protein